MLPIPTGPDLQCHRHVDRRNHALDDGADQRFVLEQRGAGRNIADLLCRTAHVDVDDLRASIDVVARRVSHLLRVGAGDLHDDRLDLAIVIHAPLRLVRIPQLRIRRDHLRNGEAGTKPLAQLPEWPVGHTGHRGDDKIALDVIRADVHCLDLSRKLRRKGADYTEFAAR